jgi:hypothetical protein
VRHCVSDPEAARMSAVPGLVFYRREALCERRGIAACSRSYRRSDARLLRSHVALTTPRCAGSLRRAQCLRSSVDCVSI